MSEIVETIGPSARSRSRIDSIPFMLGVLTSIFAAYMFVGVVTALFSDYPDLSGFNAFFWYQSVAKWWLSDVWLTFLYLGINGIIVWGSTRCESLRKRSYLISVLIFLAAVVFTEIAIAMYRPWPGEQRYRWILLHNLRSDVVYAGEFAAYPFTFACLNPAILFVVCRAVVRTLCW